MVSGRRTVAVSLLLTAAAITLALTTGAAVVGDSADTLAEERLVVQPADGPNGAYARLADDNEIAVDISASNSQLPADFAGVDPDALAAAEDVFTITYTADEYARVWIEHPGPNVTFVADGRSIEGQANSTTLGPNETVTVGLRIDTRGTAADVQLGSDAFEIRATVADPADVTTTDDDDSDDAPGAITTVRRPTADSREFVASDLTAGEPTRFDANSMELSGYATLDRASVTSTTDSGISFSIVGSPDPITEAGPLDVRGARPEAYFRVDHSFTTETVSSFEFGFSVDRAYLNSTGADPADVVVYRRTDAADGGWERLDTDRVDPAVRQILNLPADRIHYSATTDKFSVFAVATERPVVRATTISLAQPTVDPGEPVAARVTVTNAGGRDGPREMTLTVDGTPVATERVDLAPGESTTLVFEPTLTESGTYTLAVGATDTRLVVTDSATGQNEPAASGSDSAAPGATAPPTAEPSGINLSAISWLGVVLVIVLISVLGVRRLGRS